MTVPLKSSLLLTVCVVSSVCKQTLRLHNLKTRTAFNEKNSVFAATCVEVII